MTQGLEIAKNRSACLEQGSRNLAGENDAFLTFSLDTCQFVELVATLWSMMASRLAAGGVSSRIFADGCQSLLSLLAPPADHLRQILNSWDDRRLPQDETTRQLHERVRTAQQQVDSLAQTVQACQERLAARPPMRASVEEVDRRVRETDERRAWVSAPRAPGNQEIHH